LKAWQQPVDYALYQRANWCELQELPYAKPDLHDNKTLFEINSVLLVDILPPPMTRSVQFADGSLSPSWIAHTANLFFA